MQSESGVIGTPVSLNKTSKLSWSLLIRDGDRYGIANTMVERSTTVAQMRIDNWQQLDRQRHRNRVNSTSYSLARLIMRNGIQFVQDATHFPALYRKWDELCCPPIAGLCARLVVHLSKLVPLPGERGAWGESTAVLQLSGAAWLAPWVQQHVLGLLPVSPKKSSRWTLPLQSWDSIASGWTRLFLVEGLVHFPHPARERLSPDFYEFSGRAIYNTCLNKMPMKDNFLQATFSLRQLTKHAEAVESRAQCLLYVIVC